LITLYYINLMLFGIYLSAWSNPNKVGTIFLCFLICALQMFIISPLYNLCCTLMAMLVFMVSCIALKSANNWVFDCVNATIAGLIGLFFNWQSSKLRLRMEISANMLENERNRYLNESIIDELTKLNNRRHFMQTFQRYLSNYRTNDDWLCISIADLDFFKNYNDHYGHPMGDDCLRSVGQAFKKLNEKMGVYSARVGGEEFAMLWFEKDVSHADKVISNMSNLIRDMKIPHDKSKVSEFVTMSLGVYIEKCGMSGDVQALYDLADKALYIAKESGRNCAIISGRGIDQYKITPAS